LAIYPVNTNTKHRPGQCLKAGFQTCQAKKAPPPANAAGKNRDVDVQLIRDMIRQKRLSDHEAQYYDKAPWCCDLFILAAQIPYKPKQQS